MNGVHFLTGHQKVILHPKARIDYTHSAWSLGERAEEYLLGEFTRYLFFALGLGWALGTINARLM